MLRCNALCFPVWAMSSGSNIDRVIRFANNGYRKDDRASADQPAPLPSALGRGFAQFAELFHSLLRLPPCSTECVEPSRQFTNQIASRLLGLPV